MNDNFDPTEDTKTKKKSIAGQAKEDVLSNFDKVLNLNSLQVSLIIILILFVIISVRDLTKPLHPSVVDQEEISETAPAVPAL
ncbi:MAG: hypothetical protein FJX23_08375 [Alphaproteobacteria bacterium]|nr:hypothetical protein [Alphaproteobacteria bacterium]